jgi:N-acetylglucosamine-6-phosphate deacetylase
MGSSRKIIHGADVYTPFDRLLNKAVMLEYGRIIRVDDVGLTTDWSDAEHIDATGLILIPGLIELQINGAFGLDFTAEPEAIYPVSQKLPRFGVTSFLPTIITSPLERIARAQALLQAGAPTGFRGARPLGLHIEGPFLNPERKGAHRPEYLRSPSLDDYAGFSPETGIRLVTLAPELPGAMEIITELARREVVVSAGHSMATFAQAQESFRCGVRYATHLFNAMSPLLQFEPGLPGAVLAQPGLRFGLIADGIHVHPALVELIWKLSGPGRLTLVSDAMAALGMLPGQYRLGDYEVNVDAASARLSNGVLAGSILTHTDALRNLMTFTGCSLGDALTCLTTTPADLLGMGDVIGQIAPGFQADLVLMTPDLQVVRCWVQGELVYQA